ncbi:MAG: nitrogen assimilation transcriptional regulator, partial [Rhizobacter sp.]|nr:nitrogen assimilation transcriptional regulator [Rhizobacter sp.]
LPVSAARAVASEALSASAREAPLQLRRIGVPTMQVPLALCACENVPMSDAAQAVKDILLELVGQLRPEAGLHLVH